VLSINSSIQKGFSGRYTRSGSCPFASLPRAADVVSQLVDLHGNIGEFIIFLYGKTLPQISLSHQSDSGNDLGDITVHRPCQEEKNQEEDDDGTAYQKYCQLPAYPHTKQPVKHISFPQHDASRIPGR
jgi:hypothetical protein